MYSVECDGRVEFVVVVVVCVHMVFWVNVECLTAAAEPRQATQTTTATTTKKTSPPNAAVAIDEGDDVDSEPLTTE